MCDVNFTVTGSTATAPSGQTCAVTATVTICGNGDCAYIAISSWTLTVSGDTLTNSMSRDSDRRKRVGQLHAVTADGAATRASDDGGTGG